MLHGEIRRKEYRNTFLIWSFVLLLILVTKRMYSFLISSCFYLICINMGNLSVQVSIRWSFVCPCHRIMSGYHVFMYVCLPFVVSFSIPDNFSTYQWIFTKLDMDIVIVEIWFGIACRQISPIFDKVFCPPHDSGWMILFHVFIFFFHCRCIYPWQFFQIYDRNYMYFYCFC